MERQDAINNGLEKSQAYSEYRHSLDLLFEKGRTTGNNHSESMMHYAKMNLQRMARWEKKYVPSDDVKEVFSNHSNKEIWLAITEGWCGDASQILPIVEALTNASSEIEFRTVLRDEHEDLMNEFLTNGAKSIPVILRLNAADHSLISSWGPRPESAQALLLEAKKNDVPHDVYIQDIHKWYARNKGQEIEAEMIDFLKA